MLGTIRYYKVSGNVAALAVARQWGERHHYQICDGPNQITELGSPHRVTSGLLNGETVNLDGIRPAITTMATGGPAPGADDSCSNFERDVSFSGGTRGTLTANNPGECCGLCQNSTHPRACRFFTYQPSVTDGSSGNCWLDSLGPGFIDVVASPGARSGWPSGGPAPPRSPTGQHNANSQLCGATYAELYTIDHNESYLESARKVFDSEMADPNTDNYWSW